MGGTLRTGMVRKKPTELFIKDNPSQGSIRKKGVLFSPARRAPLPLLH